MVAISVVRGWMDPYGNKNNNTCRYPHTRKNAFTHTPSLWEAIKKTTGKQIYRSAPINNNFEIWNKWTASKIKIIVWLCGVE